MTTTHRKVKEMKYSPVALRNSYLSYRKGLFKTGRVRNLGQYTPIQNFIKKNFSLEFLGHFIIFQIMYINYVTACFDFSYVVPVVECR